MLDNIVEFSPKLTEEDDVLINECYRERLRLIKYKNELLELSKECIEEAQRANNQAKQLTMEKLAEKFDTTVSTIKHRLNY